MEGPVITQKDWRRALAELSVERSHPVIVHASLSAFGQVQGGAPAVVQALLQSFDRVMMPAFTYKTMLIPEYGPPDNGITYGSRASNNRMALFYTRQMPVDRLIGAIPEALRQHPQAQRSMHPIQSFVGVGVEDALESQRLTEPLAPLGVLLEQQGWVLLLGVDHSVNTSIHYAERRVGRKQFVRWALTPQGVAACQKFPGCSDGFNEIIPWVESLTRRVKLGKAEIQAIAMADLIATAESLIRADPLSLLCHHSYCERCAAVRQHLSS